MFEVSFSILLIYDDWKHVLLPLLLDGFSILLIYSIWMYAYIKWGEFKKIRILVIYGILIPHKIDFSDIMYL